MLKEVVVITHYLLSDPKKLKTRAPDHCIGNFFRPVVFKKKQKQHAYILMFLSTI